MALLLYAGPGWATVYYSKGVPGVGGSGLIANTLANWVTGTDGTGTSPATFLIAGDEFHILSGHNIKATSKWTVAGGVFIESGGTLVAGSFDHDITLHTIGNAKYNISVSNDEYTYNNLKFGTISPTSTFTFSVGEDVFFTPRNLNYPNISITGTAIGYVFIDANLTANNFSIDGPTIIVLTSTLTVAQNLSVKNGNLNVDEAGSVQVAGNLTIAGGTFSARNYGAGTNTINVTGVLGISAGTFNGSLSENAAASVIFNIGSFNMTGGIFNGAAGNASTLINISGSYSITSGDYSALASSSGQTTIKLNGSTGNITSTVPMTNGVQDVIVTGSYKLLSDFEVGKALTLSAGNLNLNGYTLKLDDALNITSGTLTGSNTSGIYFASAAVGANLPAITLGKLTIDRTGQTINLIGNVTVNEELKFTSGNLSIGSNILTIGDQIIGSGLIGSPTSNMVFNGATPATDVPGVTLQNLTISRPNGINLAGNVTVGGILTLTNGTLDNSSNVLTLANNATIVRDQGTLSALPTFAGLVNIVYNGLTAVNSYYEIPTSSVALNNLTINKSGGSGLTLISNVTVNGILTIPSGGILSAGNQTINIKNNWVNDGTFNAGTGTVNFAGATTISGGSSNTFYNVSLASGASLTVPATTTTISGDFLATAPSTFNHNNGTIIYAGAGTQNIAGLNYYNLTSTNTGTRTLNGTIGIANTFSPGTNSYTTTGSTINFNGTNQTINAFSYYNLSLSNSGTKTPAEATLTANNLTISGTAILAGSGKTINVAGNWTSYGATAFSETGSKVVFNGSVPQTITTTGGEIFNDLSVNSTSTVSLNSATTVNGILALMNGTLASGGNLTVNLNSGSVSYNTGDAGTITGNIKISKSVNSTKTHYLACPLNSATANDFADNTPVTDPTKPGSTRLYEYIDGAWSPITDMNTELAPFKAYSLYFTAPTTLDFTGTYGHGTVPSEITFPNSTSGFRMIGNPFPSTIDWTQSGWTKNNINNAIYYWDAATSKYASFVNGSGINGGTQYIPALQGFFVTTSGTGGTASIAMTNNVRITTQNPSLWRTSVDNPPVINLTAQNGAYSDETVLKFTEDASDSFDGNLDALKLKNSGNNPNLSSLTNGKSYAINSLPLNYIDSTIPLKLEAPVTGNYVISASQFSGFDTTDIILEDKLLNISHDLKSSNGYSAAITKGDTTTRFFIKFRKADVVTGLSSQIEGKVAVNAFGNTVNVYFSNIEEKEASIVFLNIIGQEVDRAENVSISQGVYTKSLNVSTGIYIVKVKAGDKVYTEKIYINN